MTRVKTFDDKRVRQLIKDCDPYLNKYIKAQYNAIDVNHTITGKAIAKIRKQAIEIKHLNEVLKKIDELMGRMADWMGQKHTRSCDSWEWDTANQTVELTSTKCSCGLDKLIDESDEMCNNFRSMKDNLNL